MILRTLLTTSIAFTMLGCAKQPQARALKPLPQTAPPPIVVRRQEELKFAEPQTRHPIKEGRPPLYYMLESAAQVEVVDAADGSVIAQAGLPERAIVSVDSADGIRAGGEQLAPGPISGQRIFQIFVTTGHQNFYRTELVVPRPKN